MAANDRCEYSSGTVAFMHQSPSLLKADKDTLIIRQWKLNTSLHCGLAQSISDRPAGNASP